MTKARTRNVMKIEVKDIDPERTYVVDDPTDRCLIDPEGLHRISDGSCDQCGAKNYV